MLQILEIDFENMIGEWVRSNRAHIKVRSVFDPLKFGVWQRLTHRSFVQIIHIVVYQVRRRFRSNERMYLLLACVHLPEHWLRPPRIPRSMNMTISMLVSNSYMCMFQHGVPRETAMYNNARDRDSNSRCNYYGNFRKYRLITRHQFSSTNHCTRRAFG